MRTTTRAVRTALDRLFGLFCLFLALASAQATTVTGDIADALGQPVSGDLIVSWSTFVAPTGQLVARGTKTVRLASGAFAIELYPNEGASPSGTFYTVRVVGQSSGQGQINATEAWVVPDSATPVDVAAVRALIPPTPTALISLSQIPDLPASKIGSGQLALERMGSGSPDGTTFLRGDGTWAVPAGSSLAVRESDGSPAVSSTALEFLAGELVVTDEGGDVSRVALGLVPEAKIDAAIARDSELFSGAWGDLSGVPATFPPSAHAPAAHAASHGEGQADAIAITEAQISDLAHFDGAYGSLSGVPATFPPSAHAPAAHAASHGAGQADAVAITEAQISDLAHFDGAYGSLSGVPATFAPTAHAASHGAGQADAIAITEAQVSDLAHTVDTTLNQEQVADFAGALIGAGTGTRTGIAVTYQDATDDVDFVVGGLTAAELAADSVSAEELNAPGVEAELEAVLDLSDLQGNLTEARISDLTHFDGAYGSLSGVPATFAPSAHKASHQDGGGDELAIAWAQLTGVPAAFTPSAHAASHGAGQADAVTITEAQISDLAHFDGAYGSLSGVPATFAPTAHAASHGVGQPDAVTITEAQISDLAHTVDTTLNQEQVEDFAGGLLNAGTGTRTGIAVTYQDATDDVDFVVGGLTAAELAADSVSAEELNAPGVEAELEAVLDLSDLQGNLTEARISDLAHFDGAYGSLSGVPATFAPAAHAASHQDGGADELALDASQVTTGQLAMARIASGTPDGTKFVRDDGTLATPAGGSGDVTAASAFGTDNRALRSDGTGKGSQASPVGIDDAGNISTPGSGDFTGSGPIFNAPLKAVAAIPTAPAGRKGAFLDSISGLLSFKDDADVVETYVEETATQTLTGKTIDGESNTIQPRRASDCTAETGGKIGERCMDTDDGASFVCLPSAGDCDTAGEWVAMGGGGGETVVWDEVQLGLGGDITGGTDNLGSGGCGVYTGSNITLTSVNALASIANHWNMPASGGTPTDPTTDYVTCLFWLGANIDTGQDPVVALKIYRAAATITHDYAMEARLLCHGDDVDIADRAGMRMDSKSSSAAWSQNLCRVADDGEGDGTWTTCEITVDIPLDYGSDRLCRVDFTRHADAPGDDNTFILDVSTMLLVKFVRTLGL